MLRYIYLIIKVSTGKPLNLGFESKAAAVEYVNRAPNTAWTRIELW